ncbi:hypothetical protein [Dyella telluris]|uniref:Uncharacterized protein n=1 Tax=Dyella telluris TaxID=2763498 RepID=A0A7G8Q1Q4_9GAMM|nr:hypothetical protein [Dyella telluris]QNK00712.1 hypothetical protein H8F01_16715 [Dyella telluris]
MQFEVLRSTAGVIRQPLSGEMFGSLTGAVLLLFDAAIAWAIERPPESRPSC